MSSSSANEWYKNHVLWAMNEFILIIERSQLFVTRSPSLGFFHLNFLDGFGIVLHATVIALELIILEKI